MNRSLRIVAPPEGGHHEHRSTPVADRKLLMWIFLASDCMFFGSLLATYFIYKGRSLVGPYPKELMLPDLPMVIIGTFSLLVSSLFMVLALYYIRHDNIPRFRAMTALVCVFGAIFIGMTINEFTTFTNEGLTLHTNLFGSTFYLLIGTHATHVSVGILYLMGMLINSYVHPMSSRNATTVDVAAVYWHFVDLVWIVLFVTVYLLEYL
jgi:heme/copper-type cytochrome/quinol oxidase subunit 3